MYDDIDLGKRRIRLLSALLQSAANLRLQECTTICNPRQARVPCTPPLDTVSHAVRPDALARSADGGEPLPAPKPADTLDGVLIDFVPANPQVANLIAVRDLVLDSILTGAVPLGSPLDVQALAARAASRIADVRLGLEELVHVGIVVRTAEGYSVTRLSRELIADIDDVRIELEGVLTLRFAKRAPEPRVEALGTGARAFRLVVEDSPTPWRLQVAHDRFYSLLAHSAGSTTTEDLLIGLYRQVSVLMTAGLVGRERSRASACELEEIHRALADRDAAAAAEASAVHVRRTTLAGLRLLDVDA
ncbi:FCD domain-containing protein [Streptomyces sp. NPDC047043]|uniref:FCD domain-containing protein n=1 Tax=Streptomyces sp. NPDC047043 TaxID=3154497 RepID=UPI0033F3A795